MNITKFTSPENQEGGRVDLNGLKPVSEEYKQIILSVIEKNIIIGGRY